MSSSIIELTLVVIASLVIVVVGFVFYLAYCRLTALDPCDSDCKPRTQACCPGHHVDNVFTRTLDDCITVFDTLFCFCGCCSIRSFIEHPTKLGKYKKQSSSTSLIPKSTSSFYMDEREDDWENTSPVNNKSNNQDIISSSENNISKIKTSIQSIESLTTVSSKDKNGIVTTHSSPFHKPNMNVFVIDDDIESNSDNSYDTADYDRDSLEAKDKIEGKETMESIRYTELTEIAIIQRDGRPPRRKISVEDVTTSRALAAARASSILLPGSISRSTGSPMNSKSNSMSNSISNSASNSKVNSEVGSVRSSRSNSVNSSNRSRSSSFKEQNPLVSASSTGSDQV